MSGLITTSLVILAFLVVYRFRRQIADSLRRFDASNREKAEQEQRDKRDPMAHMRHTVALMDEQVEEIGELTLWDVTQNRPITRYLFEGQRFASREEAEMARARKVGNKARRFYAELPSALSAPKDDIKN
jgi:hypothetical protein